MISVIVPMYNEEKVLLKNMVFFKDLAKHAELIFVDGGSHDDSIKAANNYGRVLRSKKGRAAQMNFGAKQARSDILLFLHVDTKISKDTLQSIKEKVRGLGYIGGCLTQKIDKKGAAYRLIENFGNIRAKTTYVFYGDQGIFVEKKIFFKAGGFREVPIMEDVLFTKKLRRLGKTMVLPDKITVSPRRWEKRGIIKTIFLYSFINVLFRIKVPLNKIKVVYDDVR